MSYKDKTTIGLKSLGDILSEQLPGSSWSNPIWYGDWRIYTPIYIPGEFASVSYEHKDFDGAPDAYDDRAGYAANIEAAKAEIVERFGDVE